VDRNLYPPTIRKNFLIIPNSSLFSYLYSIIVYGSSTSNSLSFITCSKAKEFDYSLKSSITLPS